LISSSREGYNRLKALWEGTVSKMLRGIIFDLDGTLVDSKLDFPAIRKRLNIPEGSFIVEFLETQEMEIRNRLIAQLESIELDYAKKSELYPDVAKTLSALKSENIKVGIFTRNCRLATNWVVENLGLSVDIVMTREDGPVKPDPTCLLQILDEWKLSPNEALYVGDFKFDIECGKRAGVKTALFSSRKQDSDFGADFVFSSFRDFMSLMKYL
jgi:HAD superfamily hydrolase (TIGR01549 family)